MRKHVYCTGLISIYKKLHFLLLQQKRSHQLLKAKISHTFAEHIYVTLDHFSSINK